MEELQQSMVQLLKMQVEQQQRNDKRFEKMLELIVQRTQEPKQAGFFSPDTVANSIGEFSYDPENGSIFSAYFRRFADIFKEECSEWSQEKKVRLLLQKLNPACHDRYCNYILPRVPGEISFDETVQILTNVFGEKSSLFNLRWKCLNLTKRDDEDFFSYAGIVNRECQQFKLEELTADRFRCLIFVQGLTASKDSEIRARILTKLEQDPNLTLQAIVDECNRIVSMRHDSAKIEEKDVAQVRYARRDGSKNRHLKPIRRYSESTQKWKPKTWENTQKRKPDTCPSCSGFHIKGRCPFKNKICYFCGRLGHVMHLCREKRSSTKSFVKAVISRKNGGGHNGRKFADIKMNNKNIRFQIDTGSDLSIISEDSWKKIGKPTLVRSEKVAKGVTGRKLNFIGEFMCNISFGGKTCKAKVYVLKNTSDLLGTDWMALFDLWDIPISSFCNSVKPPPPKHK